MQLHFKQLGHGGPLVILHGLFGSSDNFLAVAPKLAEHFHVFLLDLRNHGGSPHDAQMDYQVMAGDVAEFLDLQNLAAACVVGHSLGGKVAMQFALQHPERVRKLVVVDMAPREYQPAHDKTIAAMRALDLKTIQTRRQAEDALAAAVPSQTVRRFLLKNLGRQHDGGLFWKINLRGIAENYEKLGASLNSEKPFSRPALFVRGGKSDFIRDADWPGILKLFPQAKLETIPAARHWVHSDSPGEFVRVALQFLGQPAVAG